MGELVFISSYDEFCINNYAPFKYIKNPDSTRACYGQIYESGWHAFNEANKNMDHIGIHAATVSGYMNTVVYMLFNATDEVIENLLSIQLRDAISFLIYLSILNTISLYILNTTSIISLLATSNAKYQKPGCQQTKLSKIFNIHVSIMCFLIYRCIRNLIWVGEETEMTSFWVIYK